MNDFSYIDIFATKGIEYLIVIVFFILIVPFWKLINPKKYLKIKDDKND